jgi:hypothetical protein
MRQYARQLLKKANSMASKYAIITAFPEDSQLLKDGWPVPHTILSSCLGCQSLFPAAVGSASGKVVPAQAGGGAAQSHSVWGGHGVEELVGSESSGLAIGKP